MIRATHPRLDVHELSSRLASEYAGSVPPGRVLAYVVLMERRLRDINLDDLSRLELIEGSVRQRLSRTFRPSDALSGRPAPGT
jgi:hypothetical protein